MEKFDYNQAVATLEEILAKVEDPATGVDQIDQYVKQATTLTQRCREYLRGVREQVDAIEG